MMTLKRMIFRATIAAILCTAALTAYAAAGGPKNIDIPPGDLVSALEAIAKQSDVELLFQPEQLKGLQTKGFMGTMTPQEAVKKLLEGTAFQLRIDAANGAIMIGPTPTSSRTTAPSKATASSRTTEDQTQTSLEEVVVTAQKREEHLQDVPVPVTAISAQTLVDSNQLRLKDYYTSVPGLSVSPTLQGQTTIAIRGINTGFGTNPVVGIVVDDVPYGSTTQLGGGPIVPDLDPADLARVEVLRGPQGTLYGASSLGGLINYVTVNPSTEQLSGRVEAATSSIHNGAELGYSYRGSINVPLSDTWAIRASGFARRDPGYIDNPILHIEGVNEDSVRGGRLATLWRPSETFSLKLSALYQDARGDGNSDVNVPTAGDPATAGLGGLQQNYIRGIGAYKRKVQAYGAVITAKLGSVDLTAVSGYNINSFSNSMDFSSIPLQSFSLSLFGADGTASYDVLRTSKFTQELRLSMPLGQQVSWLIGAFYTHEDSSNNYPLLAQDHASGAEVGNWGTLYNPTTYREYAAFSDLTFNITDQFDVQVGGRESHISQVSDQTAVGLPFNTVFYGQPVPAIYFPKVATTANAFTYLVTPRYKLSPDFMVYARLASGYRPGGPNVAPPGVHVPPTFAPDKTQNYELGVKGDFFDGTFSVDASVYYIDWKDIQLTLYDQTTGQGYAANGSRAKSQGVELSVESRPASGLVIGAWISYNNAQLTEPFPATASAYGVSGDGLPYSNRWSGNLSLRQDFPLARGLTGYVGCSVSYVGDRLGEFTPSPARQDLPAFTSANLRAGAKYDSWALNLFVNNVTDRRGAISGGLGYTPQSAFQYTQPRTIGLSVAKTF